MGLSTSWDTEHTFGDIELEKFKEYYLKSKRIMMQLFDIRERFTEFKLRQSISVLSSMMKTWNGFKVKVISSGREKNRKRPNQDYECKMEHMGIMGEFAKLCKKQEEKNRYVIAR